MMGTYIGEGLVVGAARVEGRIGGGGGLGLGGDNLDGAWPGEELDEPVAHGVAGAPGDTCNARTYVRTPESVLDPSILM